MLAREELAGTQAPFPVQGLRGEIILFSQTQDSPNLPFSRKPPLKVMVRVGGGGVAVLPPLSCQLSGSLLVRWLAKVLAEL